MEKPISTIWDMNEWDTELKDSKLDMDLERGGGDGDGSAGIVTIELYVDEEDADASISGGSTFPSTITSASSSYHSIPGVKRVPQADCKTYDFLHSEAEAEYLLTDRELLPSGYCIQGKEGEAILKQFVFSGGVRDAMQDYYKITHQERMNDMVDSRGSFPYCPRGDYPECEFARRSRKQPGPFPTCCFSESHESGDDFFKVAVDTKPLPYFDSKARPPHFKERTAKLFRQCRPCENLGFVHHRNPAQHYEDYVNKVTYKRHLNKAKVWQQHLADLKFTLNEKEPDYEEIGDKCRNYKPSPIIIHATRYGRVPTALRKKAGTVVLTRKRTPLVKRPFTHRNGFGSNSNTNVSVQRHSDKRRMITSSKSELEDVQENDFGKEFVRKANSSKNLSGQPRPLDGISNHAPSRRPFTTFSSSAKINKTAIHRADPAMKARMKASLTNLIRFRQAQSKYGSPGSKRFVKRKRRPRPSKGRKNPPPPAPRKKEAKYIQKMKPNISAKFLRKSKEQPRVIKTRGMTSPRTSGKSIKNKIYKSGKTFEETETREATPQDSEQESYAEFRDENGNFDTEKYRKSILKMLETASGERRERRKKETRSERQGKSKETGIAALPKIKNPYKNVKSKTVSHFPQGSKQRKKKKGGKGEPTLESLFVKTISEISLKNKDSSERYFGSMIEKDERFSVPGFDDFI